VTALPDALGEGIAAIPDAYSQRPDADELIEFSCGGGESSGDSVRVVENVDVAVKAAHAELCGEEFGDARAFELGDIGRIFDHTVLDDSGERDADRGDAGRAGVVPNDGHDLLTDGANEAFRRKLDETGFVVVIVIGKGTQWALDTMVVHQCDAYAMRENNTDGLRHVIFACLRKLRMLNRLKAIEPVR
jgi:hypothetical protein